VAGQDHDNLLDLLGQSRNYLMQQKELFGEDALGGAKPPPPAAGGSAVPKGPGAPARGKSAATTPPPAARTAPVAVPPAAVSSAPGSGALPGGSTGPFPYPDEPWVKTENLAELNAMICDCLKCALGPTRTKFVFGVGDPNADVMFIGEGPGADEDAKGEPFVGRAGQLLNKIIEATGMKREQVYICNIVKCRPPNNRPPLPGEEEMCTPYLMKQIELVKPKFIICLGRTAAQWLLRTADGLSAMRGRMHDFGGAKLIVTYHPAALLRNPEWKKPTWEDMKMFMTAYEATRGI
jgi:uracil-DNA glycosylase family 4